jgi:hypothetical protein
MASHPSQRPEWHSRLGLHRATPAASIEDALLQLAAVAKRRRQRGYELMS